MSESGLSESDLREFILGNVEELVTDHDYTRADIYSLVNVVFDSTKDDA